MLRALVLMSFALIGLAGQAANDGFVYPDQFSGGFIRTEYDRSTYGYATHNGYVSVFNITRAQAESLLPPQFALGETQNDSVPLIVVWGEMSNTGAVAGSNFPYGLVYREMQFYIPGVYRKDGFKTDLRTYVPRMFVDAFEPEYLGRRFYYKKIQLDSMPYIEGSGMEAKGWVSLKVNSIGKKSPAAGFSDAKWDSVKMYLPQTDVMGEDGKDVKPRCSGFAWDFGDKSTIAPAKVTMSIHKKLIPEMSDELLKKDLESVATFQVKNWEFFVFYYYNNCGA